MAGPSKKGSQASTSRAPATSSSVFGSSTTNEPYHTASTSTTPAFTASSTGPSLFANSFSSTPASTAPANTTPATMASTPSAPATVVQAPTTSATTTPTPNTDGLGPVLTPSLFARPSTGSGGFSFTKPAVKPGNSSVRREFVAAPVYGDSTFTVVVGDPDAPTSFTLHEKLACKESAFFSSALHHGWKESGEKVIKLSDWNVEHFQLFFLWVYERAIFSHRVGDAAEGSFDKEWERLAKAWTLGNYLQAADFRDAVVDAMIEKYTDSFCSKAQNMHEIIYPNTTPNTLIRKLTVDIATYGWSARTAKDLEIEPAWSDFFQDLCVSLLEKGSGQKSNEPPWTTKGTCVYHEHAVSKEECYRVKRK